MTQKRKQLYNWFIVIIVIFGLYSVVSPYFKGGVYDLNHKFLSMFTVLSSVLFVFVNGMKIPKKVIFVFLLMFFSALSILFSGYISFSYYTKWIIFAISLMLYCIVIAYIGSVHKKTFTFIYICAIIQLTAHIIAALNSQYYVSMRSGTYLVLAFDNKNSAAMQLLFLGALFILFIKRFKNQNKGILVSLSFLMLLATVVLIYLTGSRSSLIAIIFMLPFLFFEKLNKFINSGTELVGILFPLIFAFIYITLYKAGYEDLTLWGRKIFNGREGMWIGVFDGFPFNWIFGMFSEYISGDGSQPFQLHNGWVDMIATYGFGVTIMFISLVKGELNKLIKTKISINYLVVVCVLGLILQSTGEAALMTGNRAIYVCLLFLFCEKKDEDDDDGLKGITINRKKHIKIRN